MPALVMHGEEDELIPCGEGHALYKTLGSTSKRLVTIPGVGHNDIMLAGKSRYYSAIKEFIQSLQGRSGRR